MTSKTQTLTTVFLELDNDLVHSLRRTDGNFCLHDLGITIHLLYNCIMNRFICTM